MKKKTIKLTEGQLKKIIENVILKEQNDPIIKMVEGNFVTILKNLTQKKGDVMSWIDERTGDIYMEYDKKINYLYIDYYKLWEKFMRKYNIDENLIRIVFKNIAQKYLNLNNVRPEADNLN